MASAFEPKTVDKGRTVGVSLTLEQEQEFDKIKEELGYRKDSDVLKLALLTLIDNADTVVPAYSRKVEPIVQDEAATDTANYPVGE